MMQFYIVYLLLTFKQGEEFTNNDVDNDFFKSLLHV